MVHGGVPSVFITSEVSGRPQDKPAVLAWLGQAEVMVACDSPDNARALSREASAQGVDLGVVIELETGLKRCGVQEIAAGGIAWPTRVDVPAGHQFPRHHESPGHRSAMPDREDRVIEG